MLTLFWKLPAATEKKPMRRLLLHSLAPLALVFFWGLVCAAPLVHVVGNSVYASPADNTAQCLDDERVCIGSHFAARNAAHLRALGITHIVTAIGEPRTERIAGVHYLVLSVADVAEQDMREAFAQSHEFIRGALAARADAKVLVHCAAGVSRSAALVIHYLMRAHHALTYDMALAWLQTVRHVVQPNRGFERQLRALPVQAHHHHHHHSGL